MKLYATTGKEKEETFLRRERGKFSAVFQCWEICFPAVSVGKKELLVLQESDFFLVLKNIKKKHCFLLVFIVTLNYFN